MSYGFLNLDKLGGFYPKFQIHPTTTVFFFCAWKSGRLTWKKLVFFAWKCEPFREKIIKNAREKPILCVKFFRKSDFSKIFTHKTVKFQFQPVKQKTAYPWKILTKCPWKRRTVREFFIKFVREKHFLCVKKLKKN